VAAGRIVSVTVEVARRGADGAFGEGMGEMGYADELFDLTGRVALVTGGSRGLGRAMVLAMAKCGADVVITSRNLESCRAVAREVEETTGRQAFAYACHVGRWDQLDGLVDAAYDRFGRVDVLVNNAGKSPVYPDLLDVNEQLWDSVLNLNLRGPFRLSVLIGNRMRDAGRGSIINISTSGALRPDPSFAPYAAAKAGLNTITVALAKEFGPTVRVNCISSGPFATDATAAWPEETKAGLARFALGRIGEPPEIVGAALYFASDASSYTTGALLRVDGGMP
jgi:NAD(P)-dependent dehydrogenase (short-subunit alcohol dehydrogenase family)